MASTRIGYLSLKKQADRLTPTTPSNFIRYKEGDIKFDKEVIANNPIQNQRHNPITAVPGKISTDSEFKFDADAREIGYLLL